MAVFLSSEMKKKRSFGTMLSNCSIDACFDNLFKVRLDVSEKRLEDDICTSFPAGFSRQSHMEGHT